MAGANTSAINAIGGPIVRKDAAERIVTAPVLVPDEPDRERHQYRAGNIREVAQSFLPSGQIDAMHAGGEVGHPTESWVAKQDLTFADADRTVPQGAWMLSAKVADEDVWAGVADGTYRGLSVFGPVARVFDADGEELAIEEIARPAGQQGGAGATPAAANSFAGGGPTREIPPAPVGTHWTIEFERATHVSIVDDPAVQAASFVVAKAATSDASGRRDTTDTPIMDDDFKKRFDSIEATVKKSAEAAEAAQDSAEQAQTAAEEAVENAGDGDGGGGGNGDGTTDGNEALEAVENLRGDLEASGVLGDGDDGPDGGNDDLDLNDADLDADTVGELVEAGIIDEDTAAELGAGETGVEKRIGALEKRLQTGGGRRASATQLDGVSEGDDTSGSISGALAGDGGTTETAGTTADGEGGDDE